MSTNKKTKSVSRAFNIDDLRSPSSNQDNSPFNFNKKLVS